MTSGTVRVIRSGLQTTVQDLGRWGFQAVGVPVAGPMDVAAHRSANLLVGNPPSGATLEITLSGPEVIFEDERLIAVAGAEFDLALNGAAIPHGRAVAVAANSVLVFGARRRGARAYLAVEGGLAVPEIMGSRSTHLPTGMGGWHGRCLMNGDCLPLGPRARVRSHHSRVAVLPARDWAVEVPRIRVVPGPDAGQFRSEAFDALQSGAYTIGGESNRMGYLLTGPPLRHALRPDIPSAATSFGVLQVPGTGQPILLMADRQTTGGYARIATVITADLWMAAQAAPGEAMRFSVCTLADAWGALIAQEQQLQTMEAGAS